MSLWDNPSKQLLPSSLGSRQRLGLQGKSCIFSAAALASPVGLAPGRLLGWGGGVDGCQEPPFPTNCCPLLLAHPLLPDGLFELRSIHSFHTSKHPHLAHRGLILLVLQLPKDKVQGGVHLGLKWLHPLGRDQVLPWPTCVSPRGHSGLVLSQWHSLTLRNLVREGPVPGEPSFSAGTTVALLPGFPPPGAAPGPPWRRRAVGLLPRSR